MSKIKYRNASHKDISKIYHFEACYMQEIEPENFQAWSNAKTNNYNLLIENIKNMYIAENESGMIGHCYWSFIDSTPYIFSIYITQKYRNKGIARELLKLIENQIKANGFKICLLSTRENNPAKSLFNKLGYHIIEHQDGWFELKKSIT